MAQFFPLYYHDFFFFFLNKIIYYLCSISIGCRMCVKCILGVVEQKKKIVAKNLGIKSRPIQAYASDEMPKKESAVEFMDWCSFYDKATHNTHDLHVFCLSMQEVPIKKKNQQSCMQKLFFFSIINYRMSQI